MDVVPVPAAGGDDEDNARLTVEARLGEPSVITVSGECDLDSIGSLQGAVDAALDHHPHLVFELGEVAFADSTFLNVLLRARNTALERQGSVRLQSVSSQVQHLLDLTGAAGLFPTTSGEQLKQP
jgi:anti-anti-sigma factor